MKAKIQSNFWYDVTREMRRYALDGQLSHLFPVQARSIERALSEGGRIMFHPDENEFYQEFEIDRIIHDPRTGQAAGARRL